MESGVPAAVRYWVFTYKFSIFFNLVQKNSLIVSRNSVAKMASLVYERENCIAALSCGEKSRKTSVTRVGLERSTTFWLIKKRTLSPLSPWLLFFFSICESH